MPPAKQSDVLAPRPSAAGGGWALGAREGLLVIAEDARGNRGLGEATPLPGYSPDDEALVRELLEASVHAEFVGADAESDRESWDRWGKEVWSLAGPSPAACFALESALFSLRAQATTRPLCDLLRAVAGRYDRVDSIPVNALCAERDAAAIWATAETAVAAGYRTLKLKVGQGPGASEDPALWEALASRFRGLGGGLRLDANRRWPSERALPLLQRAARAGVELVEEPCEIERLAAAGGSPVPVGLDESLMRQSQLPAGALLRAARVTAIVVKPALLGLGGAVRRAQQARAEGLGVIVTHLFDGPVALAGACHLAWALASHELAQGLAPHDGLGARGLADIDCLRSGSLFAPRWPGLLGGERARPR